MMGMTRLFQTFIFLIAYSLSITGAFADALGEAEYALNTGAYDRG